MASARGDLDQLSEKDCLAVYIMSCSLFVGWWDGGRGGS